LENSSSNYNPQIGQGGLETKMGSDQKEDIEEDLGPFR
jgi:hypothetical protein